MCRQIAFGVLALGLAGCGGGGVLPHETDIDASKFKTYEQLMVSYDNIQPGKTRLEDLPALGFGTRTTPNITVLSYTQIVDRFLPSETASLQHMAPAVRRCLETQDRCSGYVFSLQHSRTGHSGGVVPDLMGFERDIVTKGWSAEVVLLVQDDLVVYKMLTGSPTIQSQHNTTRPLGPIEDLRQSVGADQSTVDSSESVVDPGYGHQ